MKTQFLNIDRSEIYIPTPFEGMYHIAALAYINTHDEDPLLDVIYKDLVSVLRNTETLNSYYKLDIINLTRLNNNQLLGNLIYRKRPRSLYPIDHEYPLVTPKIIEHILIRELPLLNPLGIITTPNTLLTGDMKVPEILTINITFN